MQQQANIAYPWHVVRRETGKRTITNEPSIGLLEFSARSFGECQKYLYVAERRERQAWAFASVLIFGAGGAGAVWLFYAIGSALLP